MTRGSRSGGASGNGDGSVAFSAAANTGVSRSGTLTIGGQTFTATQAGDCSSSLAPTSQSAAATASTGNTVAVTAGTGCAWTATSSVTAHDHRGRERHWQRTTTYNVAAKAALPGLAR
jgi:hypothetical protein